MSSPPLNQFGNVGFGYVNNAVSGQYAIKVSDILDYEISFWFMQANLQPCMEVSVTAFNCDLSLQINTIDVRSGAFNGVMIPGNQTIVGSANQWNFFHGILYGSQQPVMNDTPPRTSHAAGTNLIMLPGTQKIFVNVFCTNNCLLLWNFKVKPARTPFATGFLGMAGLLEIFNRNNNSSYNSNQISYIANNFLLPYKLPNSVISV